MKLTMQYSSGIDETPLIRYTGFDSPIGRMFIARSPAGVCRISLPGENEQALVAWLKKACPGEKVSRDSVNLFGEMGELISYLRGRSKDFSFGLDLRVTPFQKKVLKQVSNIPYGKTLSYKTLARRSGRPTAVRAVAGAVAANPLPIVIPCHRVIAHDGSLGGYGGGLPLKRRLLTLEATL